MVQPTPAERTIARRVAESRATIPDLELTMGLDRDSPASSPPVQPVSTVARRWPAPAAASMGSIPAVNNAAYRDGQFELYSRINIGLVPGDRRGLAA